MAFAKRIRRPARQEHLEALVGFVAGLAERHGFAPERIKELELAVEETLVNILTYAYPKTAGDIEIEAKGAEADRLILEISDFGAAFDPLSLPVPDLLAELAVRRVGGLGVFLVRQMADAVEYRRQAGANVLTLTFSKAGRAGDD